MSNFHKNYRKRLEMELEQFLYLCGKDEPKLLIEKYDETKLQDYVRLASIAWVYGYRCILIKIVAIFENDFEKFFSEFDKVQGNFVLIESWVNAFIGKIENKDAQNLAIEYWEEVKASMDMDNFSLKQLI